MPTEYSATLLTTTELLTHVESDLATATLQRILDAEEETLVKVHGSHASNDSSAAAVVEQFMDIHGQEFVYLSREIASVTSVVEKVITQSSITSTTLASNDYETWDSRRLRRLPTGTNSHGHWQDIIVVTYAPYDDRATRRRVLIDLVKLALQYNATTSESVAEVSSSFPDYQLERMSILSSLDTQGFGFA